MDHTAPVAHLSDAQPPIFLLSGVPGAGKTSVAAALMRRFTSGLHIPIDDLREWVVSGIAHPLPTWTDETGRQFRLARQAAAHMACLYVDAGFAVAIDDVLYPDAARELIASHLVGHAVGKVLLQPTVEPIRPLTRQPWPNSSPASTSPSPQPASSRPVGSLLIART